MTLVEVLLEALFIYAVIGLATQFSIVGIGASRSWRRLRALRLLGLDRLVTNEFLPSVSVIVPAHNERLVIVDSVRSLLSMQYPACEVVVVDDGSTDGMFEVLTQQFDLVEAPWVGSESIPVFGRVTGVYGPRDGGPMVVVRKESIGNRADAVNAGINHSQGALVCFIDADSVLEDGALLTVVRHIAYQPEAVVGVGGSIRVANGCEIRDGALRRIAVPQSIVPTVQLTEYAVSFTLGRAGWSSVGGLLIISGAFGVFRRDLVVAAGGLEPRSLAEDADLVMRTTKVARATGQKARVIHEPSANCWTEVPVTLRDLGTQRRRWSRGLVEFLTTHRDMTFNPRYGTQGMLAVPYFWAWELFSPFAMYFGVSLGIIGLLTGQLDSSDASHYILWIAGLNILLITFSLLCDELTLTPYHGVRAGLRVWLVGMSTPLWFVWVHGIWRIIGPFQHWRDEPGEWGSLSRAGFEEAGTDGDGSAG